MRDVEVIFDNPWEFPQVLSLALKRAFKVLKSATVKVDKPYSSLSTTNHRRTKIIKIGLIAFQFSQSFQPAVIFAFTNLNALTPKLVLN